MPINELVTCRTTIYFAPSNVTCVTDQITWKLIFFVFVPKLSKGWKPQELIAIALLIQYRITGFDPRLFLRLSGIRYERWTFYLLFLPLEISLHEDQRRQRLNQLRTFLFLKLNQRELIFKLLRHLYKELNLRQIAIREKRNVIISPECNSMYRRLEFRYRSKQSLLRAVLWSHYSVFRTRHLSSSPETNHSQLFTLSNMALKLWIMTLQSVRKCFCSSDLFDSPNFIISFIQKLKN